MIDTEKLQRQQASIRKRNAKRRRPGPVPKQQKPATVDMGKLERRVVAHKLLERGWSLSQVAIHMSVRIEALTEWDRRGRPILGLRTVAHPAPKPRSNSPVERK